MPAPFCYLAVTVKHGEDAETRHRVRWLSSDVKGGDGGGAIVSGFGGCGGKLAAVGFYFGSYNLIDRIRKSSTW